MAMQVRTILLAVIAAFVGIVATVMAYSVDFRPSKGQTIARLLPSVVRITTRAMVRTEPVGAVSVGSLEPSTKIEESFGSGFIVDDSGYVVTNRHVIKGAYEIIVNLDDGAPLHARLIGDGNDIDIALLKVDTSRKLKPVKFGDSKKVGIGDQVLVVGNPFGLGTSVTSGIVSALNRDLGFSIFDSFIQTDAPINHGNSGGPMFNTAGEVIGVNTAYYNGGNNKGGSIGLGFAIPSDTTRDIVDLLRRFGYLKIGWLGVEGTTITPELVNALGLPDNSGVVVASVQSGAPAASALVPGDIIVSVDDKPLQDMRMLRREMASSLGKPVRLAILRSGASRRVTVTPSEWPGGLKDKTGIAKPASDIAAMSTGFGVDCAPISDAVRDQFKIERGQSGVIVTEVRMRSPAAETGLQIGDVIVSIQLKPVTDPSQIMAMIDAAMVAKRDYVAMLVKSQGALKYVTLPLRWREPAM